MAIDTRSSSPFIKLLVALVLAGLTTISGMLFVRELEQFFRGIQPDSEAFEHWTAPDHRPIVSSNGHVDLLTGCIFALESWKTAFQARDAVLTVARNCASEGDRILTYNAQLSEAYYLKAYLGYLETDLTAVQDNLARAQITAPSDQWLAVRRVNLAQKLWPGEPAIGAYNLQSDLGLLIASNRGLETATQLYIRHPSLRDMIVEATAPLPDRDRIRFLSRVKRAVGKL